MHNLSNEYFQNEFETASNEYGYELSPEFEFNNEYAGETAYELSPEFEFENQELEMYEAELIVFKTMGKAWPISPYVDNWAVTCSPLCLFVVY